jgi:hypothetical protein
MGFEDEVEQSFGRPCRQTNGRSKRTSELTSSIVPRGTSFHRSVEFEFPPIGLDAARFHAAAVACSRVQRNSVPSTHMRCMITANRRARAPIAFFIPRCLAICIAQALSQDHFFDRSMRVIFCRSDRSRGIDTRSTSAQTRHRLPWIFGSERARRRWRERLAPPRGRHRGSSSGAGTPHHPGQWPANGDAG